MKKVMKQIDAFQTGGSSPPARRAEEPNPKPITPADHAPAASASANDPELRELRERMRSALVQSFLWRDCPATRYEDERTLVTRRRGRRR